MAIPIEYNDCKDAQGKLRLTAKHVIKNIDDDEYMIDITHEGHIMRISLAELNAICVTAKRNQKIVRAEKK